MEVKIEIEMKPTDQMYRKQGIVKYRQWFRDAVDFWHDWQKEAREDFEFVEGKQWSEHDRKKFAETVPLLITAYQFA